MNIIYRSGLLTIAILTLGVALWLGQHYWRATSVKPTAPTIEGIYLEPPIRLDPFTLTQASGEPLTLDEFRGRWNVLFFGFTHCLDICPITLQKLVLMSRQLNDRGEGEDIDYWFISVDPERDTPQRLTEYLAAFDAAFRGATGSEAELRKLAGKLGVYFEAHASAPAHAAHARHDADYMVNHSGAVMVLNPDGRYQAVFTRPHETSPGTLADEFVAIRTHYLRTIGSRSNLNGSTRMMMSGPESMMNGMGGMMMLGMGVVGLLVVLLLVLGVAALLKYLFTRSR